MERASKQTIFHSTSPLRQGGCLNRQVLQKLSEKAKKWVTDLWLVGWLVAVPELPLGLRKLELPM